MVEVWWLWVMFEPVRFIVFVPLNSRDKKVNTFSKFHPNYTIAGIQQLQCCHVEMTWNQRNLSMNIGNQYDENGMVLQKLQDYVSWLAGISTGFYHKELIKISAKPGFSIWQGYWQVNFRRSIFCIMDPNILYTCEPNYLHATTCAPPAMPSYTYNYVMIVTINIQIHFH